MDFFLKGVMWYEPNKSAKGFVETEKNQSASGYERLSLFTNISISALLTQILFDFPKFSVKI